MGRIKSDFETLRQTLTVELWGSYFTVSLFHKNFYYQFLSCTLSTFLKVKNPIAVDRGKKGGLKGGKARAKALSEEERKAIGLKASHVRWNHQ